MSIKDWSENIILGELQDDPLFSEDMNLLEELLEKRANRHVVLDLSGIQFLNSSNISKLLKLRNRMLRNPPCKLRLCGITTGVWGVFLTTGLDKLFEFSDNVSSGLASIQIES